MLLRQNAYQKVIQLGLGPLVPYFRSSHDVRDLMDNEIEWPLVRDWKQKINDDQVDAVISGEV